MSSRPGPDPAVLPDPPEPQLSPVRVMLAMLVIVAVGAGAFFAFRDVADDPGRAGRRGLAQRHVVRPLRRRHPHPDGGLPGPRVQPGPRRRARLRRRRHDGRRDVHADVGHVRDARRRGLHHGPRPSRGADARPGRRRDHLLRRPGQHRARDRMRRRGQARVGVQVRRRALHGRHDRLRHRGRRRSTTPRPTPVAPQPSRRCRTRSAPTAAASRSG